jgi:hypothetical protein
MLVGGASNFLIPRLPNTGIGPDDKNIPWSMYVAVFSLLLTSTSLFVVLRKHAI